MNILVVGNDQSLNECRAKLGDQHTYEIHQVPDATAVGSADVVFDFNGDVNMLIDLYKTHLSAPLFFNIVKTTWRKVGPIVNARQGFVAIGFPGLPTFFDREVLEVSLANAEKVNELEIIAKKLGIQCQLVADQVGMITPRVICMIINEAYSTLQDKTASMEDIDLAMKLGTSYPYGPFEWCGRIGKRNVYELLAAVYASTGDQKYEICSLIGP